ncbi:MAG: DSD1 family PLP-dependent enzyme [Symbiobacteriaceae bacterium]|nr:DSD1 family PLP-dependent enzyme [Symbiobacteriaceae bacterium]
MLPMPNGTPLQELNTPCLLLDRDLLQQNIATMASLGTQSGIAIRPHTKTHKCPQIAKLQLTAGATGICTATLGEAEAMSEHGITDILITRMVVGQAKTQRLLNLATRGKIAVVCDSFGNAQALGQAAQERQVPLTVFIEINVGTGRCGVLPQSDDFLNLARFVQEHRWLVFGGLQGYAGHTSLMADAVLRKEASHIADNIGLAAKTMLEEAGIPVPVLTGGSTGTHAFTARGGYTELQAGSYATMDAEYSAIAGDVFRPALTLLATVISKTSPQWVIIDAGCKALAVDRGPSVLKDFPQLEYRSAGDEYGKITAKDGGEVRLQVGDLVELYPRHGCTTINLHDGLQIIKDGVLQDTWAVVGRGRVD